MNRMVYCDNAATTYPKPPEVLDAVARYMRDVGASPGRSAHSLAILASRAIFDTRERLAALLNAHDSSRIVFTSNATEGINTVLHGLLKPGDRVVTTSMEHNSVMRPLRHLQRTRGVIVDVVQCRATGEIDLHEMASALNSAAALVVVNHGSNVTGTIAPIEEISRLSRRAGALTLVDAAQTAGLVPIDVSATDVDFLAFSGHKGLYGPQGTGGLYIREGLDLSPIRQGGTGSNSEFEEQPDFMPDMHESGTLNGPGIAGLGAGLAFIAREGIDRIAAHGRELTARLIEGLRAIPRVRIHGPVDRSRTLPTVSITVDGKDPGVIARHLSDEGICVRAGLLCAPAAHRTIGTSPQGTVRISFGYFSTAEDVERVVKAIGLTY